MLPPVMVELRANATQFLASMGKAEAQMTKLGIEGAANAQRFRAVSSAALLAVGVAAVGVGVYAVQMADKFENAHTRLTNVTENLKISFASVQPAVTALDAKMAKLGFTNAEVEGSVASLAAATKSPTKAIEDMALAANIARGRHIELGAATQILMRVETGHVAMLSRLGIATKDASGHLLTQKAALAQLAHLYGGAAAAQAETFAGKQAAVRAQLQNAATELGVALIPALSRLADILTTDVIPAGEAVGHFLHDHATIVKPLAEGLLAAVAAWKAYVLYTKAAALATRLFGTAAVTTTAELGAEATAARAAGAAGAGAGAGAAAGSLRALPVIGLAVAGAAMAHDYTTSQNAKSQQQLIEFAQKSPAALAAVRAEYDKLNAAITKGGPGFAGVSTSLRDQFKAAIEAAGGLTHETTATHQVVTAQEEAAASAKQLASATAALTAKVLAHSAAVLGTIGSYDSFRQLLNDLPQSVKTNGTALTGYTDKAIANRAALGQVADAIHAHIDALVKQKASSTTVSASLLAMETRLRAQATAAFGSKAAVDAWLTKVGLMPGQTKKALAGLRADGRDAGVSFVDGFTNAIRNKQGQVIAVAREMGGAAVANLKKSIASLSPSKATAHEGDNFVDGFVNAIDAGTAAVAAAASQLGHAALNALRDVTTAVDPRTGSLPDLIGNYAGDRASALAAQHRASVDAGHYASLSQHATNLVDRYNALRAADTAAEVAARKHATALANVAREAARVASAMPTVTKAERAARDAAIAHARVLGDEARTAAQAASALTQAEAKKETAYKKVADAAKAAASAAKETANAAAQAAQQAAQQAASAAQSLVSAVQSEADQLTQAISGFVSTVSQGIAGKVDLASMWGGADGAAGSLDQLERNLDAALLRAQKFSADLQTLASQGASQNLIAQVAGLGPDQGDTLAQQLIAGGHDAIAHVSSVMDQIQQTAGNAATALADNFYGPGVSALDAFIAGLKSRFPELDAALQAIADQVDSTLGTSFGTAGAAALQPNHLGGVTPRPGSGPSTVNITIPIQVTGGALIGTVDDLAKQLAPAIRLSLQDLQSRVGQLF